MDAQQTQILIVMVIYMTILILYGIYEGRKVKTGSDFAIAGRKLPGWAAALSERATGESAWALLGLPGAAYATGLTEIWTAIGCVAGMVFTIVWISTGMEEVLTSRILTFFVAGFTAIVATYSFRKSKPEQRESS